MQMILGRGSHLSKPPFLEVVRYIQIDILNTLITILLGTIGEIINIKLGSRTNSQISKRGAPKEYPNQTPGQKKIFQPEPN